jgi:hypothetical protein
MPPWAVSAGAVLVWAEGGTSGVLDCVFGVDSQAERRLVSPRRMAKRIIA